MRSTGDVAFDVSRVASNLAARRAAESAERQRAAQVGSAVQTKQFAQTYYGTPEQHREFMQALQGGQAALNAWAAKYSNAVQVFRAQRKFSNLVPANLSL
jgi:hypothetical protein